jgi:hypothetical protein
MSLISVEQSVLDSLSVWAIAGLIAMIILICLSIYVVVDKYRTPKESNTVTKTTRKKGQLVLAAGLGHYGELLYATDVIPEGVLFSEKIGRGNSKTELLFQVPQKVNLGQIEASEGKNPDKTKMAAQGLINLNAQKLILKHCGRPIFAAVKDKAIAIGFYGLGALTFLERMERLTNLQSQITLLKKTERFKELGNLLDEYAMGWSAVDFNAARDCFSYCWDQTRRKSQNQWHEELGAKRNRDKDKQTKTVLLLLLGVFGMAILLVAAAYLLGGK